MRILLSLALILSLPALGFAGLKDKHPKYTHKQAIAAATKQWKKEVKAGAPYPGKAGLKEFCISFGTDYSKKVWHGCEHIAKQTLEDF